MPETPEAFKLYPCWCGKVVQEVSPYHAALAWSAFHGFVESLERGLVQVVHHICLPDGRHTRGFFGVLTLAYILQPSPPPDTYAAWLQEVYPALVAQLATCCLPRREVAHA